MNSIHSAPTEWSAASRVGPGSGGDCLFESSGRLAVYVRCTTVFFVVHDCLLILDTCPLPDDSLSQAEHPRLSLKSTPLSQNHQPYLARGRATGDLSIPGGARELPHSQRGPRRARRSIRSHLDWLGAGGEAVRPRDRPTFTVHRLVIEKGGEAPGEGGPGRGEARRAAEGGRGWRGVCRVNSFWL